MSNRKSISELGWLSAKDIAKIWNLTSRRVRQIISNHPNIDRCVALIDEKAVVLYRHRS